MSPYLYDLVTASTHKKQNFKLILLTKIKKIQSFLWLFLGKKNMSVHIGSQKYTNKMFCTWIAKIATGIFSFSI